MMEAFRKVFDMYAVTLVMFLLVGAGIGSLLEIFKASVFSALEKRHVDNERALTRIKTLKSIFCMILALILTGWFLNCLMDALVFPGINPRALYPAYFLLLYIWQLFVDLKGGIKTLWRRFFEPASKPVRQDLEDAEKPMKRRRILVKKVRYTLDDEGNEVPLDE